MEDFMYRTVSFTAPEKIHDCDGEERVMRVSRTRNSNGHCSIVATFGKQQIEFNSDLGNGYEQVAREFIQLLNDACDNPCTLPKVEK
jgi:hypothetical protein